MKQSKVNIQKKHPAGGIRYQVLLGLCVVLVWGCEEKLKPSIAAVNLNRQLPSQESWNAKITFTDNGTVTGILQAGYIASYADQKYTLLDSNIIVDFFDEQGKHTSVLTARKGKVDDVNHHLQAEGNVVVISDSGTTLKTEILYWDNKTQKVYSPAYVEITSPTEYLQGHGFESDRALQHYKVFRVTGRATTHE
jgi:LPS export ABC transporter protein LptC